MLDIFVSGSKSKSKRTKLGRKEQSKRGVNCVFSSDRGDKWKSEFCLPEILNVPRVEAKGNIGSRGERNSLFPVGPGSLSFTSFHPLPCLSLPLMFSFFYFLNHFLRWQLLLTLVCSNERIGRFFYVIRKSLYLNSLNLSKFEKKKLKFPMKRDHCMQPMEKHSLLGIPNNYEASKENHTKSKVTRTKSWSFRWLVVDVSSLIRILVTTQSNGYIGMHNVTCQSISYLVRNLSRIYFL